MASTNLESFEQFGPEWNAYRVMVFAGQHDTHVTTGEDYDTRTLASIFTMEPGEKPKSAGLAFIPSTYRDYDGREHKIQRERGSYVTLTGDIDQGDHALERIETLVRAFAGDCAWLIYSSPHALPGDMRWRVLLPLEQPTSFDVWHDAQHAFFDFMELAGVKMDRALDRAAQPVYLPNVPAEHVKSGERLRTKEGAPLHYQRSSSGTNAAGSRLDAGALAAGLVAIGRKRAEADRERERIRLEAERKRASRPRTDNTALIDDFNESTSIVTLLQLYRYEQSPRHPEDWHSPLQTGESYATRVIGAKWISLSASDAAAGLGDTCSSGCYGDAYDLYVHYEHGGDHKSAFRQLYKERRDANGTVSCREQHGSPPPFAPPESEPVYGENPDTAEAPAEVDGDALGFRITDWSTDRYAGDAPPIKWLCEGSIPLAVPALFAAMGGVGKSFMALDMALEIAAEVLGPGGGRRILGGPVVEHGSVVVFGAEDAKDSVHRRMAAIDTGGRREGARGRLFVIPLPDAGGPMTLISGNNGEFMQTAKLEAMIAQLLLIPDLKLVVFDPLQAFVTSNITSDPAAGQFMWTALARICALTGATVIACHHMRKDGAASIATADQAREAIRGSTALIDGSRATYALWAASDDDTRRVCQEAGVDHRPKRVIHGAVVKANDEHDWEIHTYLRGENGLLADAHEAGARAAQKSTSMTEMQCLDFLRKVDMRWQSGRPFSAAANSQDRYALAFIQREYGVTKAVAKGQLDVWFHMEMLTSEMVNKKSKLVGLRVAKWPDTPSHGKALSG